MPRSAGKVLLAERYAEALGIPLSESCFYTDSLSDLPMLEAVGRPVAVHPDPRLRRLARQRRWPTVDWDTGPPSVDASELPANSL